MSLSFACWVAPQGEDRPLLWTAEMYRIAGLPEGSRVTTREYFAMIHPEDRARMSAMLAEALAHGTAFECTHRLIRPDGAERWLHVHGRVEDLDERRLVGITLDITNEHVEQEARRHREEKLRHAQKMEAVGGLAGGIAHEFNNLLTVILSYAKLVETELRPDDPLLGDVREIELAATRAAELTRQLLAFSRQQALHPRVLDVNAVLSGMQTALRRLLGDGVSLELALAERVASVFVDPVQLELVIVNLVVNARDALPRGGRIIISTDDVILDVPHVLIAVSDDGVGMDQETTARVFDPFFTTKETGKGPGLGLAAVYGTVRQSGGHVWLRSKPGAGTTFEIYLPATDRAHERSAEPPSADDPRRR